MGLFLSPLIMLAVSIVYFSKGDDESRLWVRLLFSLHGMFAALLYIGALAYWQMTQASHAWAATPYLLLHIISLASIAYAFVYFPGPKRWHLLQIVSLFCMVQTVFIGSMALTGEWL
ncbi:hypothetical protein GJ699_03410 [Duganella sp. FT80W]|uniref:Uncharacterized protein n=1 Tax=Duganella guangzhouensis TaxID=2666084 RepID=A0A6I2KX79_9BURK|nr:hypothetical protein [Duganella guangzhouensis]MRW89024.1 hypothetical protein [Duganella guangzhouensis]